MTQFTAAGQHMRFVSGVAFISVTGNASLAGTAGGASTVASSHRLQHRLQHRLPSTSSPPSVLPPGRLRRWRLLVLCAGPALSALISVDGTLLEAKYVATVVHTLPSASAADETQRPRDSSTWEG
jgi:hypothetical protein